MATWRTEMPVASAMSAAGQPRNAWRLRHLLWAPHRLGFFLAMVVLAASAAWWAAVQAGRLGWLPAMPAAVSPTLLHSAVMVLGFLPLFFGGFLFTAGPRWLGVEGPAAREVAPALVAQAAGWLLWLASGQYSLTGALAGLAIAAGGLGAMTSRFLSLVRASEAEDRLHARCVAAALVFGTACLAALPLAVLADHGAVQRSLVLAALWGCIVPVFVTVAHRMIPFFTSSALPLVQAWRPSWVLWLMLGVAALESAFAVTDAWQLSNPWLHAARGAIELAAGATVIWLAIAWGLVQSMRVRLLGMLHLGFSWLGLGLLLGGAAQLLQAVRGDAVLPLAPLHAVTMGCLGSLTLAMVTRVSCGHSGRALVADRFVWTLFLLLQAATVLRVAASAAILPGSLFLVAAALLWAGVMIPWAARLANWYGRPRADGRPG